MIGPLIMAGFGTLLFCGAMIITSLERRSYKKRAGIWTNVCDGVFSHVVYGMYDYTKISGRGGRSTDRYTMEITVIYFTDGRTQIAPGRYSMEHPTGTNLRIWRNDNGDYRFVKI